MDVMASWKYFDEMPRKGTNDGFTDGLSSQERDGLLDECARTALALTALFDGEANIEEALLARTHLAECAQCDVLWQSWNGQKQWMSGFSTPVPPGLLTRVLTAIRLMSVLPQTGFRREAHTSHFEPRVGAQHDASLLSEIILISGANPFAPRTSTQRRAPIIEAPL
jgi:hypothetical protein